jgi:hypothetical protein
VYVAFDVLYRLLRQLQYEVQYVRNFTDVDDKIIKRAAESGEDPLALAGRFIAEFHTDMAALGCLEPTVSSRHMGMDSVLRAVQINTEGERKADWIREAGVAIVEWPVMDEGCFLSQQAALAVSTGWRLVPWLPAGSSVDARMCFAVFVVPVQLEPRATDYISAMIDTITKIINNGHAYVLDDGDVYFDVASLPGEATGHAVLRCGSTAPCHGAAHCRNRLVDQCDQTLPERMDLHRHSASRDCCCYHVVCWSCSCCFHPRVWQAVRALAGRQPRW